MISTGGTLLSTLLKFHKEMVNMDRLRHIEATVVELLGEEDESLRDKFLSMLELRLEQEEKK